MPGKKVVLKDEQITLGAGCNLLNLTRLLNNGYDLKRNKKELIVMNGNTKIIFDHKIQAGNRYLLKIQLIPMLTSKRSKS